ncbi:MAG: 1-acyl-sn-glycerol-3-phosphate acyltransferase [Victivallaceae bacterium]
MDFENLIKTSFLTNKISQVTYNMLWELYRSYVTATKNTFTPLDEVEKIFRTYLKLVEQDYQTPFSFELFHKKVLSPFNHRTFGLEFLRPIVLSSTILHAEVVQDAVERLRQGENVIFLANHQTEFDPHLITLALSNASFPHFTDDMIFVAGDRVIKDPLARPFSMGYDLLCIHSKRHIEHPPEEKEKRLRHNQKALQTFKSLLKKGSQCIYVAPSGGRDRRNEQEIIEIAPFDEGSIEVFRLLAKSSGKTMSFYPLALKTFDILPPPPVIKHSLGESRNICRTDIFLAFGKNINIEDIPGIEKNHQRKIRRDLLFNSVLELYQEILYFEQSKST